MKNFWKQCLTTLKSDFDEATFDAFIKPVSTEILDNGIALTTPNKATERWLKRNVESRLLEMLKSKFPDDFPDDSKPIISYQLQLNPPPFPDDTAIRTERPVKTAGRGAVLAQGLNPKLNFSTFVPGKANKIPLCAAHEIATGNKDLNPLFIYGNTGLGKTHLAHAVGNEYLKLHQHQKRVLCTSANDFMKSVVHAYRLNKYPQFEERFYALDMLIIDDIQFLGEGDRRRTQEEFFTILNKMQEEGKSVVITGDSSPQYLKNFPTRLTSRLSAGLSALMRPPEFELRVNIVKQKSKQWNMALDDNMATFIAEQVKSNVRELEGAVRRVLAMARFQNIPPSLELCHRSLEDVIGRNNKTILPGTIKQIVANFYHINASDLSSQKRHRSIAHPRHVAVYLCRNLTQMSLPEIGQHFGKRNHTTILHSCRQIKEKIKEEKELRNEIDNLKIAIKES